MGVWVGNVYLFPVDWLMIVVALCIWPMALLLYFPIYLFSLWFVLFSNIFYNVNIVVCNSIDCIFMFLRFILWFHKLRLHFCFVFWLSLSLPYFFLFSRCVWFISFDRHPLHRPPIMFNPMKTFFLSKTLFFINIIDSNSLWFCTFWNWSGFMYLVTQFFIIAWYIFILYCMRWMKYPLLH